MTQLLVHRLDFPCSMQAIPLPSFLSSCEITPDPATSFRVGANDGQPHGATAPCEHALALMHRTSSSFLHGPSTSASLKPRASRPLASPILCAFRRAPSDAQRKPRPIDQCACTPRAVALRIPILSCRVLRRWTVGRVASRQGAHPPRQVSFTMSRTACTTAFRRPSTRSRASSGALRALLDHAISLVTCMGNVATRLAIPSVGGSTVLAPITELRVEPRHVDG